MRVALGVIVVSLLAAVVVGVVLFDAAELPMFLLGLALVTFFGSMPVVLGVLTRGGGRARGPGEQEPAVTIRREDIAGRGAEQEQG